MPHIIDNIFQIKIMAEVDTCLVIYSQDNTTYSCLLMSVLTNFLDIACRSILGTNFIVARFCPASTATTWRSMHKKMKSHKAANHAYWRQQILIYRASCIPVPDRLYISHSSSEPMHFQQLQMIYFGQIAIEELHFWGQHLFCLDISS